MSTTINGQLSISMLIESILLESHSLIVQTNTDGVTIRVRRDELEHVLTICRNWEKTTKLMLEYNYYKMMVIVDVSTYLAQYEDGSVKLKNDFEIDKEIYKNPSMRIVPIALREYFVNNTPVEETIRNHRDIYDFCLMARVNKNFDLFYKYIENHEVKVRKLSKTLRYYASKRGGTLYKRKINDENASILSINVGQPVTLFNQYQEKDWELYNIDYKFYINECMKIINKIEPPYTQLTLF